MKNLLIGLVCVISLGYFSTLNELHQKEKEVDILVAQNEQYEIQIQELSDQQISLKEMFQIAAEVYQVDFDMLYAISKLETKHFQSDLFVNHNNPGGIKDFDSESGWASYDTQFEGIMEMARLLRRNYLDQGLTTVEEIGSKYCPDPADN